MPRKPDPAAQTPSRSDRKQLPAAPPENATHKAAQAHHRGLAWTAYFSVMAPMLCKELKELGIRESTSEFICDFLDRINPRDPMEELLAVQALMAHIRVLRLTFLAGAQAEIKQIQTCNEYADRASNTYRRLMLALAEYRRPPRTGDSFTAIKQANIAQQQVVQNGKSHNEMATNEQGCHPASPSIPAHLPEPGPAVLPIDTRGAGLTEILGQAKPAVGAQQRAADG